MSNIDVTPGAGKTVATETVGGLEYQRVEILGQGGASVLSILADGSIKASVYGNVTATFGGNASVSGTVGASVIGTVPITQGGPLVASVSGTVGASVIGTVPVVQSGIFITSIVSSTPSSVLVGASIFGALPAGNAILGAVAASISGTVTVTGTVGASVIGTVPVVQSGTVITSIASSIPSSVLVGASIFGALPAGNAILGAVAASISGTVTIAPASVSGTVGASIVGQLPAGTAVLGSVAALQGTTPWIVTSSIAGGIFPVSGSVAAVITNTNVNVSGSVVAFQGTAPWATVNTGSIITIQTGSVISTSIGSVITVIQGSSILAVPVGSVITVFQAPSIVGTYAEDAASASGDKGFLVMGARNDTLASVTSADGDYSSHVVGPAGELIAANAPFTKWVQGTASMLGGTPVNGGSVAVIAAQGSSIFTYITGVQVMNASANNVWLRFDGATSSVMGFTVVPANGGSNIVLPNAWKTNANGAFTASVSGVSSVYISAQGFISKT